MRKLALCLLLISTTAAATLLVGFATVSANGTAQIVDTSNHRSPLTVSIIPQSGTAGTIEFSNTANAAAASSVANWQVLGSASNVSVSTTVIVTAPISALRFTRTSGASAVIGEVSWNQ